MFGQSKSLKNELRMFEPKTLKAQSELPKVNFKEHIEELQIRIQILTEQLQQKTKELQELKTLHLETVSSLIVNHEEQKDSLNKKCKSYEETLINIETVLNLSTEKQKDVLTRISQFCERTALKSQSKRRLEKNGFSLGEKNVESDKLTSNESRKNEAGSNSIESNDEVQKEGCFQRRESEQMANNRKKRYISANTQIHESYGYREQHYERKKYYGK